METERLGSDRIGAKLCAIEREMQECTFWDQVRSPLGLGTDIRPLLSHSTTGEFTSPPNVFADTRKMLKIRRSGTPLIHHRTTEEYDSPRIALRDAVMSVSSPTPCEPPSPDPAQPNCPRRGAGGLAG
eukprot:5594591-Pyramimonas_sp.AAC.1